MEVSHQMTNRICSHSRSVPLPIQPHFFPQLNLSQSSSHDKWILLWKRFIKSRSRLQISLSKTKWCQTIINIFINIICSPHGSRIKSTIHINAEWQTKIYLTKKNVISNIQWNLWNLWLMTAAKFHVPFKILRIFHSLLWNNFSRVVENDYVMRSRTFSPT